MDFEMAIFKQNFANITACYQYCYRNLCRFNFLVEIEKVFLRLLRLRWLSNQLLPM